MDRSLVALAVVVAFGGGVGVGYALRGAPSSEPVAIRPNDEPRNAPSASAHTPPTPSVALSIAPRPTVPEGNGIAIADPIGWPSIADPGFAWPTTIPPAGGVRKLDDTHYQVDRDAISEASSTMKSARIVAAPATLTTPAGARFYAIRSHSPLDEGGLHNGDLLAYVDEFAMESPDKALEAYSKLRSRHDLALRIVRAGKPLVLHWQITHASPKPLVLPTVVPPKKP